MKQNTGTFNGVKLRAIVTHLKQIELLTTMSQQIARYPHSDVTGKRVYNYSKEIERRAQRIAALTNQ